MQRDDTVCIKHVLDAARKAVEFSKGRNRADIHSDEMLALSLVRLLEIVGEAASDVSEDYRKGHPDVPWKKMVGLRNRLIHGYFDVNYDIVWDTVVSDLPPLITEMEKLLPP